MADSKTYKRSYSFKMRWKWWQMTLLPSLHQYLHFMFNKFFCATRLEKLGIFREFFGNLGIPTQRLDLSWNGFHRWALIVCLYKFDSMHFSEKRFRKSQIFLRFSRFLKTYNNLIWKNIITNYTFSCSTHQSQTFLFYKNFCQMHQ